MKVIDLLNKIANNEEVPMKIKFRDLMLDWDYEERDYKFINTGNHFLHNGIATSILNVEIEIIEEQKELKPIEVYKDCHKIINATENESELFKISCELMNKTNEIINKYNELIERIEFDD